MRGSLLVRGRHLPAEEADREEERVDAAFLQVGLCYAGQDREAALRLLGRAARDKEILRRVAEGDGHLLFGHELVLEPGDVAADERQHLLHVADVQHAVAQGEVEQLLRPAHDARRQRLLFRIRLVHRFTYDFMDIPIFY